MHLTESTVFDMRHIAVDDLQRFLASFQTAGYNSHPLRTGIINFVFQFVQFGNAFFGKTDICLTAVQMFFVRLRLPMAYKHYLHFSFCSSPQNILVTLSASNER